MAEGVKPDSRFWWEFFVLIIRIRVTVTAHPINQGGDFFIQ